MPGFVRTKKDEVRWSRAKQAAAKSKKKGEDAFTDQDWALTNHIYHQMGKAEELGKSIKDFFALSRGSNDPSSLEELKSFLEKARRRMSDEVDPYSDEDSDNLEEQGFREFDPDAEQQDDADKWLEENDTKRSEGDEEPAEEDEHYDEYAPDEDEEAHQREVDGGEEGMEGTDKEVSPTEESEGGRVEEAPQESQAVQAQVAPTESRFPQPSKEEIADMRQYTRPWEQRARERTRLEAEAHKNPVLHHEGKLVEARNAAHKDRQSAYEQFQSSPDYQAADPITQMEMEAQFDKDWHDKNPDYASRSMQLHSEAHKKGQAAKDIHAAAKDEQIRHVLSGGAQSETPMSLEEGMQHAGGAKGEEGTEGSVAHDPASSFAAGNQAFLSQYAKDYEKKGKKPKDLSDMTQYDEGSKADIGRILGEHPALKDPAKKAKVDAFFAKYHPLIAMNTHKVLNKLGIDHKKGDVDLGMLHEAGMHGLFQAINDYEHDHPSKAAFATHAGNKIRGLMQTAMKSKDVIPGELRVGAKKFGQQAATAPKTDINALMQKHPPHVADRLKRIDTFRQVHQPKTPKSEGENNGHH